MSLKAFFLILLILACCTFIFLKIEVLASPNSHFNQTTRFTLGKYPLVRTLLGLHDPGDARAEYLEGGSPLVIEWFEPVTESVDKSVIQQFADLAAKHTGKQTQIIFGGTVSEGTVPLNTINNLGFKGGYVAPSSALFYVVFTGDYQPRDSQELSATHGETGAIISLNANHQFVGTDPQQLNSYLLADMLHEFGNQIGLPEQGTDPSCIMNLHAGIDGQPLENSGLSEPQYFCPAEVDEINSIKESLQ